MTRLLRFAALVAATGLTLAGCHKSEAETVDTAGPIFVRAEAARLDAIRASVTVTGTIAPSPGGDWTITAPESGRVAEITKAEGDSVNEGDILVRFEVPSVSAELAAHQSESAQVNTRLQTAKSNATRVLALVARGIAPQRDGDEATRELQEAEAAMRALQSSKDANDLMAARLIIKARFTGVVAKRWHNTGDAVVAGADDPVLRIIDPTRLEIIAPVPTSAGALMAPGRVARIFNPTDGSVMDGAVINIPAASDAAAATMDVRVSLPKTATLAAGTPVQLEILSDERANALTVPSSAVMRDGAAAGSVDAYVMVAGDDGKAHRKSVVIGLVAQARTQILSGLTAGERVILAGSEAIADGAAIAIQK